MHIKKIIKNSKIKLVEEILSKRNLDVLIIFPYQKIAYYLIKDKERNKDDITFWIISNNEAIAKEKDIIRKIRQKKIKAGAYLNDLSYAQIKRIRRKLKIVDISEDIDQARKIKTKDEIENIKKACKINKKVYEKVILKGIFNLNEIDLAKEIEKEMINNNAKAAFSTIVGYGKNTPSVHHIPRKYISKDIVMIDFGSQFNGYCSDITLTISKKKEYKKVIEDVHHTLSLLEDYAREGTHLQDLKKIAEEALKKYKKGIFSNYHSLGHGVGIEIHELPSFNENEILSKNMIITLEPAIYFKGKYGVRLESTYLIRKEKRAKNLCPLKGIV